MRFDLVIVGSGFGGAVTAARLGTHITRDLGGTALVLEKGNDHSGVLDPHSAGPSVNREGNRFRNSLSPEYLADLTDVHTDLDRALTGAPPTMNVAAGTGVGGGSNVYCGVSLRAPQSVFERQVGGDPAWPADWSRSVLDPYYRQVEAELRVHRLGWTSREVPEWQLVSKRDYVFAEGCRRVGATASPLKVATFEDANDGWWTSGQVMNGRQDLSKNYLKTALTDGVELWSGCRLDGIAPTSDGYVLSVVDTRGARETSLEIECGVLVLAAGAIGSTSILLGSQDAFTDARRPRSGNEGGALGQKLSANGDYGVTGRVGPGFEFPVEGHKGKPMCSFSPTFWQEHGFLLIPFYAEPVFPALGQISSFLPAEHRDAVGRSSTRKDPRLRDWGGDFKERLDQFSERTLTMGCLALDESEGEIVGGRDTPTQVRWTRTDAKTETRWSEAFRQMRGIYEALGGEIFADTYRTDGTVSTSHPLGGCRMSESPEDGVVGSLCEVHNNENLFVIDSGAIPAALGVNPSLTIAAMAERVSDSLIRGLGTASARERIGR